MKKRILVQKMNGDMEPYDSRKVERSLKRSGANRECTAQVLAKVEKILYEGISTKKIFEFVHKELERVCFSAGLRYNLKNAMVQMRIHGGYVFEKFVGRIMEKRGYKIRMNETLKGKFVTHEIDVSAEDGDEKIMVEVKHRVNPGERISIQTALYVYARFLDLGNRFTKPMIVTNAKFSDQTIRYSKGMNIGLIGWRYPYKDSLEDNIERYKLYPITCLDLSKNETRKYLESNILTVQELRMQDGISERLRREIDEILK